MINNKSIIQQNTELFLANNVSEEMVFMNLHSGSYLGLNAIGTAIWRLIDQPNSVQEIVSKLMERYNVDRATCEQQTIALLEQMQKEQLIIIS